MRSGLPLAVPFGAGQCPPKFQSTGGDPVAESSHSRGFDRDVVVIGGCGHGGLPLAMAFASLGLRVGMFDVSEASVALVTSATMPFVEPGAGPELGRVVAAGRLEASADPGMVGSGEHVIVVVGTP